MLTINVVKIYTFLNNKILKQNGMTQQRLKKETINQFNNCEFELLLFFYKENSKTDYNMEIMLSIMLFLKNSNNP